MPTYEYACPTCGIVEVFQSIKEAALKKCPQCKKQKVTRMISGGGGVIFKGSGFWETDYNRSSDYQKKSKDESEAAAPAQPPAAPKTQAEPKKAEAPKTAEGSRADTKGPKPEAKPDRKTDKPTSKPDGGAPTKPPTKR